MVFKGRFFSSKKSDTSSPDGSSNSPRSFGSNSNSPIRSDKKKPKSLSPSISKDSSPVATSTVSTPTSTSKSLLKKKDSKGRETLNLSKPTSGISNSSSSPSKLKKSEEPTAPAVGPTSASMSPIVASSLGLNKIKTRSGPLPLEVFFSFGSREKGVPLGASNLSRPLGGRGGNDGSDVGSTAKKKKEKPFVVNVDNDSNSDSMSTESGQSRDQSPHVLQAQARSRLQNGESSSVATGILL